MSNNTFFETMVWLNKYFQKEDMKDCIFIKDIKIGTDNYAGTNVDVLCLTKTSVEKLTHYLKKNGFSKEKISFEFDKYMFFPPSNNSTLTKVHIYPHLAWYTAKINFSVTGFLENTTAYEQFKVLEPKTEIPLLLFHAYFEDRILRTYDILHIRNLLNNHHLKTETFISSVNSNYLPLLYKLLKQFETHYSENPICYTDTLPMLKFVWSSDNLFLNKLYFTLIHLTKKTGLIRG